MDLKDFDILNPQPDAIRNEGGSITVETSGGSMWGRGNTCRNLLLRAPTRLPLRAELRVTIRPEHNGEQAGLVIYRDCDNYIKLVREMVADRHVVVLARELQGKAEPVFIEDFASPDVALRLTLRDELLEVEWQTPGADDSVVRTHENWLGGEAAVRVGLLTHGRNPGNCAVFSSFRLTEL